MSRSQRRLLENVRALLDAHGKTQHDLSVWMAHHDTWISKILLNERRLDIDEIDQMAAFFGLDGYQLLMPGIAKCMRRVTRQEAP